MGEPFLAEVRMMGFNFAPRGWAFLDGQILPINQNQSLYSLLGTTYGGDGRTSFALPDLRGRSPMHADASDGFTLGNKSGQEVVALSTAEMPSHSHNAEASTASANSKTPSDTVFASEQGTDFAYNPEAAASVTAINSSTVGSAGGDQGHDNMQPYLAVNFCIALQGLFPSRN